MRAQCVGCNKFADELDEYIQMAKEEDMTPDEFAATDGTYNEENGHFTCTDCYIKGGMPSSKNGWTAP